MKVQSEVVRFVRHRPWALTLALLVAVPFATTVVEAAIPEADGDIHACYKVYNGEVRIIDTDVTTICGPGEEKLSWSSGQLLTGNGQPTGSDGDVGDLYLDLVNKVIWGPKTSSGWGGTGTSLIAPPVLSGLDYAIAAEPLNSNTSAGATATCPDGKKVISGGVYLDFLDGNFGGTPEVFVVASFPLSTTQWHGAMQNKGAQNYKVVVRAICAAG